MKNKIILAVIIILTAFFSYKSLTVKNINQVHYLTAAVQKGTIIVSVSGSGQVTALDQVDVKSKVSSDLIYLGIMAGQEINKGTLIARLDTTDSQQAVRNAQISLDQAKIDLEKMQGLTTSEGTIRSAKEKATSDLQQTYEDGFNTVANAFLQLPSVMSGLQDILLSNSLSSGGQWNLDFYANSVQQYNTNFSFPSPTDWFFGPAAFIFAGFRFWVWTDLPAGRRRQLFGIFGAGHYCDEYSFYGGFFWY